MNQEQKDLIKRQQAKLQDYRRVFTTEQGKRVLHDMMLTNYVLNPTWSPGASDRDLAYREGARSVVLKILTLLEVDPNKLRELARGEDNGVT